MTITYARVLERNSNQDGINGRKDPKPPPRIWYAAEPPFKGQQPVSSDAYKQTNKDTVIVIDNGTPFASFLLKMRY